MTKHLSHSQVIPYLQGLSDAGIGVTILSFEEKFKDSREEYVELARIREIMAASNIRWKWLRYHKRPSLPATAYDVTVGSLYAMWLVLRYRIDVVHSRGYVPSPIALLCKWLCGTKFVFDVRGLMAEEYVDSGAWKADSLPFRITKWFERLAFRNADSVIVLTEKIREILQSKQLSVSKAPVTVIPCCVQLERFGKATDRAWARDRLGITGGPVMAYVGSLGTWYMSAEMVTLFKELLKLRPTARFLLLTQFPAAAEAELLRQKVQPDRYLALSARPEDLPRLLSAADLAIAFIKPCYSKLSSSPTKVGEYLAAGLPFITNRGIGDIDELVERNGIGTLVDGFDEPSYQSAIRTILQKLEREPDLAEKCRMVAEQNFSMRDLGQPAYVQVYRQLEKGGGQ